MLDFWDRSPHVWIYSRPRRRTHLLKIVLLFGFMSLLSTHADRQGVDISVTVCLFFVCVFVRLRISPPSIKLAASNFARRFMTVQGKESYTHFWEVFSPRSPKSDENCQRADHANAHVNITVEMRRRKRHARDAPFVKSSRRRLWTYDRHVWIYESTRRRTYLLYYHLAVAFA